MEDLPDETTEPVGDRPYGLVVRLRIPSDHAAVVRLENRPLRLDRGIRCLVENPAHRSIAFGSAITAGLLCGFLLARTSPYPGAQVRSARELLSLGTDFS